VFDGSVHGVVVHATSDAPSSQPTTGNAICAEYDFTIPS
jgi:hypothetical protein